VFCAPISNDLWATAQRGVTADGPCPILPTMDAILGPGAAAAARSSASPTGHDRGRWIHGSFGPVGWVVVFVLLLCADPVMAQPRVRRASTPPPARAGRVHLLSAAAVERSGSSRFAEPPTDDVPKAGLRQRLGLERAKQLLQSPDVEERLRGIDRLATLSSSEVAMVLVEALAPGSAVRVNPKTRLAAVRALARHAAEPEAHGALLSVFNGGRSGVAELPLHALARETAAMALARAGSRKGVGALVAAVVAGGAAGRTAGRAIVAHPPRSLRAITGSGKKRLPPRVIQLLGELGDPRAIGVLRRQLRHKQVRVRIAAIVALARLGDGSVEPTARRWLRAAGRRPELRLAAVEVLQLLGVSGADEALVSLLSSSKTQAAAFLLAARAPSVRLLPALRAVVERSKDPSDRLRALSIVARVGGGAAADVLIGQLGRPETATAAALGLARMPGLAARAGLERALAGSPSGGARRLVLRAGVVRFVELGEVVDGLPEALDQALRSSEPADRAAGSFGLSALGLRQPSELIGAKDPAVATAAARAVPALGAKAFVPCQRVLEAADRALSREVHAGEARLPRPSPQVISCGFSLLVPGQSVSATTLARWADRGGALAPVAALALAKRDSGPFRSRVQRLLAGTDPVVRSHVAFGLAHSPKADATSLLTGAYRFEPEPAVRRALVRALSVRSEPVRRSTLELARKLDPDLAVRAAANAALRNVVLAPTPVAPRGVVAWLSLRPNAQVEASAVSLRAARVVRSDGLAVPVVSAPDGVLVVPGLSQPGGAVVLLAP